jgi:hypothetical protein
MASALLMLAASSTMAAVKLTTRGGVVSSGVTGAKAQGPVPRIIKLPSQPIETPKPCTFGLSIKCSKPKKQRDSAYKGHQGGVEVRRGGKEVFRGARRAERRWVEWWGAAGDEKKAGGKIGRDGDAVLPWARVSISGASASRVGTRGGIGRGGPRNGCGERPGSQAGFSVGREVEATLGRVASARWRR